MVFKISAITLRIAILPPGFYLAYVVGCFFAVLMSAPSEIFFYFQEMSLEQLQDHFTTLPKSVLVLSYLLLGIPFISELTGVLYIYTGNRKHLFCTLLFVAWKVFLILWIGLVGGKGV